MIKYDSPLMNIVLKSLTRDILLSIIVIALILIIVGIYLKFIKSKSKIASKSKDAKK